MRDDSERIKRPREVLNSPDHELVTAKSELVILLNTAVQDRGLTIPAVARIVGVSVDVVARVLRGDTRSFSVSRLGAWLEWVVSGRGFEYSDDNRNSGEDFSSPALKWIDEANVRASGLFLRLRREARGRVHPLRYEALLRRMEHIVIELGGEGSAAASKAEMRMTEFEDDLAALLAAEAVPQGAPAAEGHTYREDEVGYGEYGLGVEEMLHDTGKRLERLRLRLRRRLRGRLPAEGYEGLSGRVARAAVEFRGSLHEAMAATERTVIELRAEIDARAAELDTAEGGD